jgi:hypothetical protein
MPAMHHFPYREKLFADVESAPAIVAALFPFEEIRCRIMELNM